MDEIVLISISAIITIFSLGLLLVSLASYRKYHNTKLLFVTLVFLVFLLQGILLSLNIFFEFLTNDLLVVGMSVVDTVVLVLLFLATLKR